MRRPYHRGLAGWGLAGQSLVILACLGLSGCAGPPAPVSEAQSLALLRAGRAVLGCREPCLAEWRRVQPQAAQLDAGGRSHDLAALLMRVGYQDDLSLYYLGRAAEGLGYRAAAASYYRQSMQLSGTPASCQHLSRQCGGVALPRTAAARLAAVERMSNALRARRTGPAPPGPEAPETPEAAPGEAAEPAPGPVSAPPAGPGASPGGPAPFEYIEPPPAAR